MNYEVGDEAFRDIDINILNIGNAYKSSYTNGVRWKRDISLPRKYDGLILVTGGAIEYRFPGRTVTASKGDVLKFVKDSCYTGTVLTPSELSFSVINFSTFGDAGYDKFPLPIQFKTVNYELVHERFDGVIKSFNATKLYTMLDCKAGLYGLLTLLVNEYSQLFFTGKSFPAINDIIDYINAKYGDPALNVSELCRIFFISPAQLRRKFHLITGMPPNTYIRMVRIKRAKYMLKYDNSSISDTASACGFASPYYFSHVFRECEGVSPNVYRSRAGVTL